MKSLFPMLLVVSTVALAAQAQDGQQGATALATPVPPETALSGGAAKPGSGARAPYEVLERGPHHRVMGRVTWTTNAMGRIRGWTNSYTELATGLNYLKNGNWVETSEQIDVLPGGLTAAATNGPHQAYFPADLYTGVIEVVGPDGKHQHSRPACLNYFDGTNNVLIAQLTNSIGQILPSGNQVIWTNCFTGIQADIIATYRKGGFECDLVLRSKLPSPAEYGLGASQVQLFTEFFDTPEPTQTLARASGSDGLRDVTLDFGALKMVRGKAFSVGERPNGSAPHSLSKTNAFQQRHPETPVYKRWGRIEGRTFLIEEVPYQRIASQLNELAAVSGGAAGLASTQPLLAGRLSIQPRTSPVPLLAPFRPVQQSTNAMQVAQADLRMSPGLVWDYVEVTGETNAFTFESGKTYYLLDQFDLQNTATIQGGTVIKYHDNYGLCPGNGIVCDEVVCQTGPYRMAVLTSENDDSVGETLPWSTGTPWLSGCVLYMANPSSLKYLRIANTYYGVFCDSSSVGDPMEVSDCQFLNCAMALFSPYVGLHNVLFSSCEWGVAFWGEAVTVVGEHITADGCRIFIDPMGWSATASLTNCLFTELGTSLPDPACEEPTVVVTSSAGTYQTVGAGSYYLATNSPYRNAGTVNIDPTLLADLRRKTTQPPMLYSNLTVTSNVTLSPVAQRDTNASHLDLGYHYEPIDYLTCVYAITNATLTITNGTVIGYCDDTGIWLRDGAAMVCEGTPMARNRFVSYRTVQEQPVRLGNGASTLPVNPYRYGSVGSPGRYRFTDFSWLLAGPGYNLYASSLHFKYSGLEVRDCAFMGGSCYFTCGSDCAVGLTNNLFETQILIASGDFPFAAYNNLFHRATVSLECFAETAWAMRDNAFDSGYLEDAYGTVGTAHDHNAFINEALDLAATDPTDMVLTNFAYASGPLGDYYQAGTVLADQGSRSAVAAGLNHYTTTTNEAQEAVSTVDIGFHYPLSDADGNGLPDIWELQYFGHTGVDPNDDPDADGLNNYQEYVNHLNPLDSMVVAWGNTWCGVCDVPPGLTTAVGVAGGYDFSLALKADGTVVAWGADNHGESNVPAGLTNVTSLAAGGAFSLALLQNGTVVAWGANDAGQLNVPAGLTNVTAIAAGYAHAMVVRNDGTVAAWGWNQYGQTSVPTLEPVKKVAAGWGHSVALLTNGTVVAWGYEGSTFGLNITDVPVGLSNVVSIAAGGYHTLALKADGTVTAWGAGGTNTSIYDKGQSIVPAGLSNVVAVSGGDYHSVALQSGGTVVVWGDGYWQQTDVPDGLTGVAEMSAGGYHGLAVRSGRLTPLIYEQPVNQAQTNGGSVTFTAEGLGPTDVLYQWQHNGTNIAGATNTSLTLTSVQSASEGRYQVVISNGAGSITSAEATFTLITPPVIMALTQPQRQWAGYQSNLTLSVTASAPAEWASPLRYGWRFSGTNISGATASSYTIQHSDWPVEGSYSVGISNAAGSTNYTWQVRVMVPGTVVPWGGDADGVLDRPVGMSNILAVASGFRHAAALPEDGRVIAWGNNDYGQTNVPGNVTNVIGIGCGTEHTLALKADGTVAGWGRNNFQQTNAPNDLTNAVAISAGGQQSLALKRDGTVTQWGQTNAAVPTGLSSVAAMASGTNFHLALLTNSTVVAWGANEHGQTNVPTNLTNVVAVAAGGTHALALRQDGHVVAWGSQTNVPSDLTNAMAIAAGSLFNMALRNDGTVVAWGDNTLGQTNVPAGLGVVKSIAAGGNHALAVLFSRLVQYPVDVTKDLLLIYNTNSLASSNVCAYYLQHRPMVSNANVLAIGCPTDEIIDGVTFTNDILVPVWGWLAANPTKHPQYVILFPDMPTRAWANTNYGNSVAFGLSTNYTGIQPFVTSINMGLLSDLTNDCIAYINKLEQFGTNYSPGKLFISPGAEGYGNTNYLVDDVAANYGQDFYEVRVTTNGLLAAGVSPAAITYLTGNEVCLSSDTNGNCLQWQAMPHITNATDVAGYISWGLHSTLGNDYARNTDLLWSGDRSWWIIETIESFNGQRSLEQGNFRKWFSDKAFGGSIYTNYECTPVGAVSHTDEPGRPSVNDAATYFGLWAQGKSFGICAWYSRRTQHFQAVGDPFVRR